MRMILYERRESDTDSMTGGVFVLMFSMEILVDVFESVCGIIKCPVYVR